MYTIQERLNLIKLDARWSKDLWAACEVIHYSYRQDFLAHHLFYFSTSFLITVSFLEASNCIFIFVSVLPPVRAKLTYITNCVSLEAVGQLGELFVDLDQVLEVKLDIIAQFFPASFASLLITSSLLVTGILFRDLMMRLAHIISTVAFFRLMMVTTDT